MNYRENPFLYIREVSTRSKTKNPKFHTYPFSLFCHFPPPPRRDTTVSLRGEKMECCNSELGNLLVSSMAEFALLDTLLLLGRSLACHFWMTGSLLKDLIESTELPSTDRFPINEIHRKEKPGPENTDSSDTEDDEEGEDDVEDQEDPGDEDYSGEEGGDNDDEGDPDEAEANGEGGSDDEDDDDDDEDGDEEDDDDEGDEEEDEEEEDQPPAKKRK